MGAGSGKQGSRSFFHHMSTKWGWMTNPFGHSSHVPTPYLCSRESEVPKKDIIFFKKKKKHKISFISNYLLILIF